MIQAIKSCSGFIAILFFIIAAGTIDFNIVAVIKTLICVALGLVFTIVELHEAKELGFFN